MASSAGFFEVLEARVQAVDSLLCVGLDPHAAQVCKRCSSRASLDCRLGHIINPRSLIDNWTESDK